MSVKRTVGLGVLCVLGLGLLGAFFVPNPVIVEESIIVNAPVDVVFDFVNRLPDNEKWSPWNATDPTIMMSYSGKTEGVGAWMTWASDRMGQGKMTISSSRKNESIVTELDFGKNGKAEAYWSFVDQGQSVYVTWRFMGDSGRNPIRRYFGYFVGRPMIQSSFKLGLERLKNVAEAVTADQLETALHRKPDHAVPIVTGATN